MASSHRDDYQTEALRADGLPLFYQNLKCRLVHTMAWNASITDLNLWRQTARDKLLALIGVPEQVVGFDPVIIDEQDRGGYVARKVAFNLNGDSRVLGLMLVPKRLPAKGSPAVLLLHDHGACFDIGKEKVVKPWGISEQKCTLAQAWCQKCFSGYFVGDTLAQRGYVVLAVDALGWGDRGPLRYEAQQALASNLFNLGDSLGALMAREDRRAAQFLASQQEVDAQHISAVGFSMGAYRAWQVAALSDEIAAAVAVGWMGTTQGLMCPGNNLLKGQSAFHMMIPGVVRYLDFPDIASLAAPKPMLLFNGEQDALFPAQTVREAYTHMQQVWQAWGASDALQTHLWPSTGHVFTLAQQEAVFDWMQAWCGSVV